MASVLVFPDSEELFRVEIAARVQEVTGDTIPARTRVPNPRPAEFIVVRRVGGVQRDLVTDVPVIQVEVWAATESRASRISAIIQGLMNWFTEIDGYPVGLETVVTGPSRFPDGSEQERYVASYSIAVRGRELITIA